ncbi:RNA polymerase sigma factor [Paractinoplanes maris]|uniref:RNA polymerase sigma factor n=1 Tax=Paractinoplanes maris TaxID=1734446 RepID=UPI00202020F6|nr:sigma-70 family RNA polymerase sigma factor [Actinoplanes maris]
MTQGSILADPATSIDDLVDGARRGDQAAWDALVRRFRPLVGSVARTYRLPERDAEDVSQFVWLRLTQYLDRIRDPHAVPKWIMTTARHECHRLARQIRTTVLLDPQAAGLEHARPGEPGTDAGLLRAERHQALRDGLAELPAPQQQMLLLLVADPPFSYREISRILDIPIGSIGPTRARCLQRLRATTAVRRFLETPGRPA